MVNMFQPKVMLVTGGAGFIGSCFIQTLVKKNLPIQIINLDKLTYAGDLSNLDDVCDAENYHFVQGDICDKALVQSLFEKYCIDTVVHFAAESHVDRSITGPEDFVQTNVVGTFTLLDIAKAYWEKQFNLDQNKCRFHHISTDEVFGTLQKNDPAFTETTAYAPNSPYSASKAASDHFVRAYFHTYKLPVTMSNCSNNYGPHQHGEKLIPTIIKSCYEQKSIPVYGDGSNIRDWLYVYDHCDAILEIVRRGRLGESYNVGGNNEVCNLDVVKTITTKFDQLFPEHAPHEKLIGFVEDRKGHDWRYAIDTRFIENELGVKPKQTFASGLDKTIEFVLSNCGEESIRVHL